MPSSWLHAYQKHPGPGHAVIGSIQTMARVYFIMDSNVVIDPGWPLSPRGRRATTPGVRAFCEGGGARHSGVGAPPMVIFDR